LINIVVAECAIVEPNRVDIAGVLGAKSATALYTDTSVLQTHTRHGITVKDPTHGQITVCLARPLRGARSLVITRLIRQSAGRQQRAGG